MRPQVKNQIGAVSLLMAILLLTAITALTLITARVVLVETKIEANDYRTKQAVSAANSALDYGIQYFMTGGLDQVINADGTAGSDGIVDVISSNVFTTVIAQVSFDNNDGSCTSAGGMDSALITATGFSDDSVARRTITQCVGTIPLLKDGGPDQPLISKSNVATTGNANIINRYSNMTVWSGDTVAIGNSAAMSTYLNDGSIVCEFSSSQTDAERAACESETTTNVEKISSSNLGNGFDIIDEDPSLANLNETSSGTDPLFFENFFNLNIDMMEILAQGIDQYYVGGTVGTNTFVNIGANVDGKSGIIFIDGNASLNSNVVVGSRTNPAILIIDGNFKFTGNPQIYGILYVVGQMDVGGTITVVGSSVVEGDSAYVPAGEEAVEGTGTLNLVYAPSVINADNPIEGSGQIVSGSWRDW